MLVIRSPEEKGNQMASAPIPKHGFSSKAAMEEKCPCTVSDWFEQTRVPNSGSSTHGAVNGLCQYSVTPFLAFWRGHKNESGRFICRWLLHLDSLFYLSLLGCWTTTVLADNREISPFVAVGAITTEYFMAGQTTPNQRAEFSFRFAYSNDWWEVEVRRLNAAQGIGEVENCSVVPGGVRYYVLFKGRTNDGALNAATVCPLPFPPPTSSSMFLTWLSLCPAPQLPMLDGPRIHHFLEDITSCSDRLEFMNAPQNVADCNLAYLNSNASFLKTLKIWNHGTRILTGSDNRPMISRYSGRFEKGFMDTEFQVTETTNRGGVNFPLRTLYQHYAPNWVTEAPDDLYSSKRSELSVSQFSFEPLELSRISSTPEELFAVDFRPPHLPKGTAIKYTVRNDQWKPVTDPKIESLTRLARQPQPPVKGKASAASVTTIRLLFGLVVVAPIVVLLVRAYNRTKTKQ